MKTFKRALSLVLLCLAFLPSKSFADSKNLYLSVGDEQTITLPYEFTSNNGTGHWSNSDPAAIEMSGSMYSVKIKVLKWVYHTCLVEYDYYYTKDGFSRRITYSIFISINKPVLNLYINHAGGTIQKGYKVTLRCSEPDAKIYYTLDGYNPSTSSNEYNNYYGIVIEKSCTLKAFATWGGANSDVLTANYTVEESEQSGLSVSANPSGGSVSKGTTVYLTSSISGAEIYYTLDGSTPSKSSHYYSSGITINESCTLKAIAYKSGYKESSILTEYYTVDSGSGPSQTEPTSISVSPSSKTIKVGDTFTVSYTLSPSNASTTVTWSSDDTSIATVSSSGTVTGKKTGTTYINAKTSNGKTSYCKVTVESGSTSKDIAINSTNFPDANFRNYLLEQDYGKDGVITKEEFDNIKYLDIGKKKIASLVGIEYFVALIRLDCSYNQLSALDISNNVNLNELSCYDNEISDLDLSNNTALTEVYCFSNKLSELDVSNNVSLTHLDLTGNQIATIDVSRLSKLKSLDCGSNLLTTLDISNNAKIVSLYCDKNKLSKLNVSNLTNLSWLKCGSNQLTTLDLSNNLELEHLECGSNQLTSLDVTKNTALTYLNCSSIQLVSLDVSKNKALKQLYCYSDQLTSLDVSKNTALTNLDCRYNQLTSLDVSKNTALNQLYCDYNQLASLDVSKNTALTYLRCDDNQLTLLDVSKNTALNQLYCDYNQLTSLDVSKNTALTDLGCYSNQLTSLDVSKNTALTDLDCRFNQLTSLIVSKSNDLKNIYCYGNCIKSSAMDDLIKSLATNNTSDEHKIYIVSKYNEQNVCTTTQVDAIKAKGWKVYDANREEYLGSDPSGIEGILMDADENAPVYDLSGKLLSEPRKGINIIGGKKVLVK